MSPFENIVDAIHGLSHEEKFKLRVILDKELKPSEQSEATSSTEQKTDAQSRSRLIGLFADEPELMDRVMETVYEHRSRPLRVED
jgi:hypothetical protein